MVTGSYVALSGSLVMIVIEKIVVILFLVVWLVTVMFCEHHLNVLATIFNCTILDGAGLIVLAGGADRLEL